MRANYKVPNRVRRKIIDELYTYWENRKMFEELEADIIDSTPERDETGIRSEYLISKPTETKALKLADSLSTRALIIASRKMRYIDNALKRLNKEEYTVVETIFRDRIFPNKS